MTPLDQPRIEALEDRVVEQQADIAALTDIAGKNTEAIERLVSVAERLLELDRRRHA